MKTILRSAGSFLGSLLFAVNSLGEFPPTYPNSLKYRDSGAQPATSRAGSATIQARALFGKDTMTDIEISTGQLDVPGAPGNIDKVQIKLGSGSATQTTNYNNLESGGSVRLQHSGLVRSETIQIQSNVSGIDPKRTDVVTVETSVQLRPDLAMIALDAPAQARPGVPVNIHATVGEMNGDVGARADCLLLVDGVQMDQSRDIWVDAEGIVSCIFTHTFSTVGSKKLAVSASNVRPGDYDQSNNTAEYGIDILNPTIAFRSYAASVREEELHSSTVVWSSTLYSSSTADGWFSEATASGEFGPLQFDGGIVSVQHLSDAALVSDIRFELTPVALGLCTATQSVDYHWLQACRLLDGATYLTTWRKATDVTYHSEGWNKSIVLPDGSYYTFNNSLHLSSGSQVRLGSVYEIRVTVQDSERIYEANPLMELQLSQTSCDQPLTCFFGICFQTQCSRTTITGSALVRNY